LNNRPVGKFNYLTANQVLQQKLHLLLELTKTKYIIVPSKTEQVIDALTLKITQQR
jgi:hypothetical protein